jgi:hypothetical protein
MTGYRGLGCEGSFRRLCCVSCGNAFERTFDNKAVELGFQRGRYDGLLRQTVHRLIPRPLRDYSILERPRKKLTDFFAFERYQLVVGVVPVELRAKIQGMNSRIVSFQHEIVPLAQENVVLRY